MTATQTHILSVKTVFVEPVETLNFSGRVAAYVTQAMPNGANAIMPYEVANNILSALYPTPKGGFQGWKYGNIKPQNTAIPAIATIVVIFDQRPQLFSPI
jgi:hypothetical protein